MTATLFRCISSLFRLEGSGRELEMEKHEFFRWLSEVHLRQLTHGVELPNVPALAFFVQFTNEFNWSDFCYQEVLDLGQASGIHLADFLRLHRQSPSIRGASPANPILLDDDNVEDVTEDTGDSRLWSHSFRTSDCSSPIGPVNTPSDVFFSASQGSCTAPN